MFAAVLVSGIGSARYLFKKDPAGDRLAVAGAELAVLFGAIGLVTGPLWAKKAWGVAWQWDAKLTTALLLELIFVAYIIVRKYGGPGSEKLAAALALTGVPAARDGIGDSGIGIESGLARFYGSLITDPEARCRPLKRPAPADRAAALRPATA